MSARSRWRIAPLEFQHRSAMQALFARVFGHPMSDALWQWKYGNGRGHAIGVWNEHGQLIAHYAGFRRAVLNAGQAVDAVQIGDVMVEKTSRAINLGRRGAFFQAAARFLESYIGYGKPYLIGFGFPNARAMRVAARLGLYADTGGLSQVTWPVAVNAPPPLGIELREIAAVDDPLWIAVDPLWAGMRLELRDAIVGVRDADWLRHRYLAHPDRPYRVGIAMTQSGEPIGIIVLRAQGGIVEWMDVIGTTVTLPALVAQARWSAATMGGNTLMMWVSHPFAGEFARHGGTATELDVRIPCNVWSPGPDASGLRDRWFLLGGDTDFR